MLTVALSLMQFAYVRPPAYGSYITKPTNTEALNSALRLGVTVNDTTPLICKKKQLSFMFAILVDKCTKAFNYLINNYELF